MLVCACQVFARQGTPLTVPVFAELATNLAGNRKKKFSRHFVSNFISRHSSELTADNGKITSPTRSLETMLALTKEFILNFNMLLATEKATKDNIFVFDETIIGCNPALPLVIGETKESAGRNNNVVLTTEPGMGSVIPFSMVDGSTPFRVLIVRTKELYKSKDPEFWLSPEEEKTDPNAPHRVFLHSESGYISIELFSCIMDEFAKWWTSAHPGLDCYLICDNLSIHRNEDIVATMKSKGIHFIYIMPGSSHWFQVHDHLPFAQLKKTFMNERNMSFASFLLPRDCLRALFMAYYYDAEKVALDKEIVMQSFSDVGLWPFDPTKIEENCRKFCPVLPGPDENDDLSNIARAIHTCIAKELDIAVQKIRALDCVSMTSPKKGRSRKSSKNKTRKSGTIRIREKLYATATNATDTISKPARKRGRPRKSDDKN